MLTRCTNPKATGFDRYGGRGIDVCDRWRSFENFLADMGERPMGLTIDRKDNNGCYCKENCRWITVAEQNRNTCKSIRITVGTETKIMADWSKQTGIATTTIHWRLAKGWDPVRAVSERPHARQRYGNAA
jgi:hypothetical protein